MELTIASSPAGTLYHSYFSRLVELSLLLAVGIFAVISLSFFIFIFVFNFKASSKKVLKFEKQIAANSALH